MDAYHIVTYYVVDHLIDILSLFEYFFCDKSLVKFSTEYVFRVVV